MASTMSMVVCLGVLAGCGSPARPPASAPVAVTIASPTAANGTLTLEELDQLTYAFADRYFMSISSAVDRLKRNNPDASQRRTAHRIKVNGVLALNDIASSQDSYTQVLNLLVAVTLESTLWIDENQAETVFGERAPILIQSLIEMRRDAWALAARVMTPEQMERLEFLIATWRRQHPQQDQVSFVKFDEFASSKASNLASELRSGGGLLAPLSEATYELHEYRRLAERAFWYTKRAPSIAGIQAEAATNEIMASPEISQLFGDVERVTASIERVDQKIATVITAVQENGPQMAVAAKDLLGSLSEVLRESRLTIAQVEQTLVTAHTAFGPLLQVKEVKEVKEVKGAKEVKEASGPPAPPGRPFNILEYTEALRATKEVLQETNQLAGQSATASVLITQHLSEAAAFTDARMARVFQLVWVTLGGIFAGGLLLIVIGRSQRKSP